MIFIIESTCGGDQCHFCDNLQETWSQVAARGKPFNVKLERPPDRDGQNITRYRFCASCGRRFYEDLNRRYDDESRT